MLFNACPAACAIVRGEGVLESLGGSGGTSGGGIGGNCGLG